MAIDVDVVLAGCTQLMVVLLGLSSHEAAHAMAAAACGDSTGAESGRSGLNPARHIDVVGSLVVPLVLVFSSAFPFGWGRPFEVDLSRLRQPARDHVLVTLAGPAANAALAAVATVLLATAVHIGGSQTADAARAVLLSRAGDSLPAAASPGVYTLVQLVLINGFLALLNLLPIPPLDGGQLVLHALPADWASRYSVIRPYGFMIVLGLALFNVLALVLVPVYVVLSVVIAVSA